MDHRPRAFPFRLSLLLALGLGACAPALAPPVTDGSAVGAVGVERERAPRVPVPASFDSAMVRGTRSESGAPGGAYWQQRVRYEIQAELEPSTALLSGSQRITYRNDSPDTLGEIVLNLYQNVFAEGVPRNRAVQVTGGTALERVAVDGQVLAPIEGRAAGPGYRVNGTVGRLTLPRPLEPGGQVVLEIEWSQHVPPAGTFRTAWEDALGGRAFQIAGWYPQVAVYDDLHGWDATPYLGDGEFYQEFADFEVAITVPAGWLVGATGELLNPEAVLTDAARARLAAAASSDTITPIVTRRELEAGQATRTAPDGRLTWRFHATNVRDFAFATSNAYQWDATRARVPAEVGGERLHDVAIHALYRPGASHWEGAARFAQHATEYLAGELGAYIYPQVTMAEGSVGGMEYPQLVFIGKPAQEQSLYAVIAHEVAHQWLPMMVGPDEAAFAWLDEGLASYYDVLATAEFYGLEGDVLEGERNSYLAVAGSEAEVPMMRHTDLVSPYGARVVAAYRKPAVMLGALRQILGEDTWRQALHTFLDEWHLRKPSPWDFFNTVERVAGRDLDWFFQPWYFTTGMLDQAIVAVEEIGGGTVRITVEDRGEIPMPSHLQITMADGRTLQGEIPVTSWLEGAQRATVSLEAPSSVVRVELDAEHHFPDVDRSNNLWEQ